MTCPPEEAGERQPNAPEGASLAERVAVTLSGDGRQSFLTTVRKRGLHKDTEQSWGFWGRTAQQPPEGDWRTWLILAGRGFGKTRAGAEWVRMEDELAGLAIGGDYQGPGRSPDRADALVWAMTELMLGKGRGEPRVRGL